MTNDSSTEQINHQFVILISVVATIGGFLFGFDSGVINGTVDGLRTTFNSQSMGTGFNVASMLLGCAVGAFFAGWFADQFGRRIVLMAAALLFLVSAWGSGIAGASLEFIIYRVIGGMAVGAASVIAPAYISEVAPTQYRGRLTTIQQIAIIIGLTVAFLSNYMLAGKAGGSMEELWMGFDAWRWMFWVELIPAALFFILLFLIPESPRYLVASGRTSDAQAVLARLFGQGASEAKVKAIAESLADDHKPRLRDLYDNKLSRIRPIVWVGIGLAVFQQLVGINVIFYYGAVLWQAVGFSENDALFINVVSGLVSIAACCVTIFCVDKIGRKPLLWIGSVGMSISLVLMAVAFSQAQEVNGSVSLPGFMGVLALLAANFYVICFNFSWGPVMWVMLGEMFPNQIRGSGLAVAGLFQWLANFVVTMTFLKMLNSIGLAGAYSVYAFFAIVSIVFVIKFVHETKGVELEKMQG